MDKHFLLSCKVYPDVVLRSAAMDDCESLRNWKNTNRRYFFYQEEISVEAQGAWFCGYLSRRSDYMFIVNVNGENVGCMGIRNSPQAEIEWDIYNVILGHLEYRGKGYMSQALYMMCSWAHKVEQLPIRAKVLSTNPALSWYFHNDFTVISEHEGYVKIELDKSAFLLNRNAPQVALSLSSDERISL